MKTLLVIDSHFMCHRAFHTCGDLSHRGIATGVIYGFLKSVHSLMEQFSTENVVFCFEGKDLLRKKIYPGYKAGRNRVRDPEKEKAYSELNRQIYDLRTKHLPACGFKNIFCEPGFESDDLMADIAFRVSENMLPDFRVILVTSDSDMYQCLHPLVGIWNPIKQKLLHWKWFDTEYKIRPEEWPWVKAVAGCPSDNVKGIPGIGEKTALKYLWETCHPSIVQKVKSLEGQRIIRSNLELVRLPHAQCPRLALVRDEFSQAGWGDVCTSLGIRSIPAYQRHG